MKLPNIITSAIMKLLSLKYWYQFNLYPYFKQMNIKLCLLLLNILFKKYIYLYNNISDL